MPIFINIFLAKSVKLYNFEVTFVRKLFLSLSNGTHNINSLCRNQYIISDKTIMHLEICHSVGHLASLISSTKLVIVVIVTGERLQ